MRWRTLALMVTVGIAIGSWASPAAAKGPDQATITGPGLDEPIVVTGWGEPGSGGDLAGLADGSGLFGVMFESGVGLLPEAPDGPLGARVEIAYRVPDGTPAGSTVRQDLYPLAQGGPLTYTEAGQAVFGSTTRGGWYRTPASFVRVLEQLGLPNSAQAQPPVEQDTPEQAVSQTSPSIPWLPIGGVVLVAVVALAAVLLGRRRAGQLGASAASGG
jgi:hypothetical protein